MIKKIVAIAIFGLSTGMLNAQKTEVVVETKTTNPIRIKSDTTINMTVIVDGDKVTINGKQVEENDPRLKMLGKRKIIIDKQKDDLLDKVEKLKKERKALKSNQDNDVFEFETDDDMLDMDVPQQIQNKAFLGVATQANPDGAIVNELVSESPAAKAGLKVNDIITKINEVKITSPADLYETIGKLKPEDKITISYLREGKKGTTTAQLAKNKSTQQIRRSFNYTMPKRITPGQPFNFAIPNMPEMDGLVNNYSRKPKLGISIEDLAVGDGVTITKVIEGSLADKAGLKVKDTISKVDDEKITEVADLRWDYFEAGKTIRFEILRNGEKKIIEVKIPKKLNTADL